VSDVVWAVVAATSIACVWIVRGLVASQILGLALLCVVTTVALVVCARRRDIRMLLVVGLVVACWIRVAIEVDAFDRERPARAYTGVVRLRSDPVTSPIVGMGPSVVGVLQDGDYVRMQFPLSSSAVASALGAGQSLRVVGQFRPNSGQSRWRYASSHVVGDLVVDRIIDVGDSSSLWRLADSVRQPILRATSQWPRDGAALYDGIVVGDDRLQPAWQQSQFRRAGLSHLMAVSGQNVAFVLVVLQPFLQRCSIRKRSVLIVGAVTIFAVVTRLEPSVLRAVMMAGIATVGTARGQPVSTLRALSLTVVAWLLIDPFLGYSLGFLLSVSASLGLAILTAPLQDRVSTLLPSRLMPVASVASATIAAQLATAPLIIFIAGGVPIVSLFTNVVAVPIAGIVMTYGMSVGLLAGVLQGLDIAMLRSMGEILMLPMQLLVAIIAHVASIGSALGLPRLTGPAITALVVLVASAIWFDRRARLVLRRAAIFGVICVFALTVLADRLRVAPTLLASGTTIYGRTNALIVLDGKSSAAKLLRDLERDDVVTISAIVVVDNSLTSALVVDQLTRAYSIARVVVPWGKYLSTYEVVGANQQLAVRGLAIRAEPVDLARDQLIVDQLSN